MPNNLRLTSFPDSVIHYAAILDFELGSIFLIDGVLGSKTYFAKVVRNALYQIPSAIMGPPGGHFGL